MSTGANKNVFRTSINGYNKEDVNNYIQNENRRFGDIEKEHLDKIDELLGKINDLHRELDKASDKLDSADSEIPILKAEKESLVAKLKNAEDLLNEKDDEIVRLKQELVKLSSEKDRIAKERDELANENEELKSSAEKYTAEDSAADRGQISDMIFRARNASEDMLKRAEEGAVILLGKAKEEVNTCRAEAVSAAKEIFDAATEELRRSIGICMNDFVAAIRNAKCDPERSDAAAEFCDDDLGRRIERMQNDLDRAIAEKLAEFDGKK